MTPNYQLSHEIQAFTDFVFGRMLAETIENWAEATNLAVAHEVLPQFCQRVLDSSKEVPGEVVEWSQQQVWALKARSVGILHAMANVEQVLQTAGIPIVWLKGAALACSVYEAFWMRQMVDIDVLVPFSRREQANVAMLEAGYKPYQRVQQEISHHYVYLGHESSSVAVEVHYHLVSQHILPMTDEALEWFWSQTTWIESPLGQICVLKPEATLLHLALHDILQHDKAHFGGFGDLDGVKLRRKYDINLLLSKYELDWELVITQVRLLECEAAVNEALTQSKYLFHTKLPEHVTNALLVRPTANVLPIERRQQLQYLHVFSRLPWQSRMKYIWSVVFLAPEVMRERYNLTDDVRLRPYYAKRLWYLMRQLIKDARSKIVK